MSSEPGGKFWGVFACLMLLLLSLDGHGGTRPPAAAHLESAPARLGQQTTMKPLAVNPDGYTSARVCGGCHTDIYNSWKKSMHAFALSDPIFDTAFMQSLKEIGEEARRRCLHCHAPMTMMNGDYDLNLGVSREGVSCDFCHTVTGVHLDGRDKPYSIDLGIVKRGVIKHAASPAHEVAYSDLHGKSEFCAGCHNLTTADGVSILGTYDEWKAGPYAQEGIQCQDCHMVLSEGKVAAQGLSRGGQIHLHSLIHDSNQLRSALSVQITGSRRRGQSVEVDVLVENIGSGHMVPTGIPTREIILQVEAVAGGYSRAQERRYRKVVADKRGRPLQTDYEVILSGARILTDNRIAPREKRMERFYFPVRNNLTVKVNARLFYHYSPPILKVQPMKIELGQAERFVP